MHSEPSYSSDLVKGLLGLFPLQFYVAPTPERKPERPKFSNDTQESIHKMLTANRKHGMYAADLATYLGKDSHYIRKVLNAMEVEKLVRKELTPHNHNNTAKWYVI